MVDYRLGCTKILNKQQEGLREGTRYFSGSSIGRSHACDLSLVALIAGPGQTKDGARGLDAGDWVLNGTLSSRNCGVALSMNLTMTHMEKLNSKSIKYTLMMTAVSFIQVSRCVCAFSDTVLSC